MSTWICARAEQAAANGWGSEEALRITALEPQPWDVGAVMHVLPDIGALPDLDWSKPLSAWSKDEMVRFLLEATKLIRAAVIARDVGGRISDPGMLRDEATASSVSDDAAPSVRIETPASEALKVPGNGEFHDEPIPF